MPTQTKLYYTKTCFHILLLLKIFQQALCWMNACSGIASYGALAHIPPISNNFIFSSFWSKSHSQLSKYCVVCEISLLRCQQLTALSISTALVTTLLVIEQLLHPALKSAVSVPGLNLQLIAPPRNKSWRHHCMPVYVQFVHYNFWTSINKCKDGSVTSCRPSIAICHSRLLVCQILQ